MKITSSHVFEITSKEMAASYMKCVRDVVSEYGHVDDCAHAERVISNTLESIEDDMEAIFVGNVSALFRQGLSFMLVPDLIEYEKEIEDGCVKVYITDRNITILSYDICY
jgi:hypothetical protein